MRDNLYSPLSSKFYKKDGSVGFLEDMFNELKNELSEFKSEFKSELNEIKSHLNETKHIIKASMGQYGGQYSGAATITPDDGYIFVGVRIITEAVLTCNGNIEGVAGITFEANTSFEGRFTSITITSGTIIAYQGIDEE
jgi:hypothetical protein